MSPNCLIYIKRQNLICKYIEHTCHHEYIIQIQTYWIKSILYIFQLLVTDNGFIIPNAYIRKWFHSSDFFMNNIKYSVHIFE